MGGSHPVLLHVGATGVVRPVPLRPTSPYAKVADLSSLASDGTQVFAIGEAHGGAHANFRWTTWSGSVRALTEYPQTFETFGGISAGALLDVVVTTDGPVIAGSWSSADARGLDAAIWLPRGQTWQRQESAGGALANRDDLQVAPRAAAAFGTTMIITGSVITFGDGVQQSAGDLDLAQPGRGMAADSATRARRAQRGAVQPLCRPLLGVRARRRSACALAHRPGRGRTRDHAARRADRHRRPGATDDHRRGPTGDLVRPLRSEPPAAAGRVGRRTFTAPDGRVLDALLIGTRLYAILGAAYGSPIWLAAGYPRATRQGVQGTQSVGLAGRPRRRRRCRRLPARHRSAGGRPIGGTRRMWTSITRTSPAAIASATAMLGVAPAVGVGAGVERRGAEGLRLAPAQQVQVGAVQHQHRRPGPIAPQPAPRACGARRPSSATGPGFASAPASRTFRASAALRR